MPDTYTTPYGYYASEHCVLDDFRKAVDRSVADKDVPHAARIEKSIPIYDVGNLQDVLATIPARQQLMSEWARVIKDGAGVFVLKQAQADHAAIDAATECYQQIIAREKAAGGEGADHFAAAGSNDRIWNSLQKLCLEAPRVFLRYFASPAIDAAAEAWLGPNYQMTAQINLVRPGGQAQQAHRDYHLGFQSAQVSASYPAHVHDLSPLMTLQGGIAHCDMPVESGPTKLLPFSQTYRPGYAAWRREDFRAFFEESYVQLSLEKGDAIFFNPALFHAAGENRSENVQRMVNLLQVSSAFGRAMESIDRAAMCHAIYRPLCNAWTDGEISEAELNAVIACCAEGYSFPTNLDRDPPVGGLAPQSQSELLRQSILAGESEPTFRDALGKQDWRKQP